MATVGDGGRRQWRRETIVKRQRWEAMAMADDGAGRQRRWEIMATGGDGDGRPWRGETKATGDYSVGRRWRREMRELGNNGDTDDRRQR